MHEFLWIVMPFVVALGSGLLSFIVAQARMQVALAREREALVEARAILAHQHKTMGEKIKATEAEARRKALDEFLSDVRVEERHYLREKQIGLARRKSLVLQERIYFRNIPLSHCVEHEMPVEEGDDLTAHLEAASVFGKGTLQAPENSSVRKLLR